MTLYEPHNLWGVVGILVVGLFFLASAVVTTMLGRRDHRKQLEQGDDVKGMISDLGKHVDRRFEGLSAEMREERASRERHDDDLSDRVQLIERRESFG